MLESALAYLPRRDTNEEPNTAVYIVFIAVLTDRYTTSQSVTGIRLANIEIGVTTMFSLFNCYISELRKETGMSISLVIWYIRRKYTPPPLIPDERNIF